jgi:uncharacterized DUF497 family protein
VFEWDTTNASVNEAKHGVSFDEAATISSDPDGNIKSSRPPGSSPSRRPWPGERSSS